MANIVVRCEGCGKRYQLGESLAGKRVKCKACGAVMAVPATSGAAATVDAHVAQSSASDDPFSVPVFSEDFTEPNAAAAAAPEAGSPGIGRARLDFPRRKEVVLALPWVLVGIGLLLFVMTAWGDAQDAPRPWIVLVQFGVALLLYLVLVIPLSVFASRFAGKKWGYTLLPPAWAKMAAAFAVPLGLMYLFFDLSGWSGYAIGFILGLPVAFFTVWLLFRLQLIQAVWSSVYSGLTFVILAVGMALLSMLVANVITNAVVSYEAKNAGEQPKVATPAEKKPAPETPKEPDPTLAAQPVTPPAPGEPAPPPAQQQPSPDPTAVTPQPTDPFATSTTPPSPEPAPTANIAPEPKQTGPVLEPPITPKQGTGGTDTATVSPAKSDLPPFIKDIVVAPQAVGEFDRIIYPTTPSDWMAVVRRRGPDEDVVDRFNAKTLASAGNAMFKHKPNTQDQYLLSANGDWFVRIADWPQLSAQVWSFEKDALAQSIQLNPKFGDASLLSFLGPDHVVIHWDRKSEQGLEVWDVKTGAGRRPMSIIVHERAAGNLAVSPDGRTLAVVAKGPGARNEMLGQLYLYDMTPPANRAPRRLPIVNLDPRWPVRPSGVAFSPDGSKIGVLFEQDNNALLLCWDLNETKLIEEHTYPGGLLPSKDLPEAREGVRRFTSRALDWLGDGKTWLIYGSGLFDVSSGRLTGQLGVPGTIAQRVVGDDVHLISDAIADQCKLTVVKLDLAKLAEWKIAPRRDRAPQE